MRRLAAALLSAALLAAAGWWDAGALSPGCPRAAAMSARLAGPGDSTAAHRPACRMTCCKRSPRAAAAPAPPGAACTCGRGGSQPIRQVRFAAGTPSILPAPPRLPAPRSGGPSCQRLRGLATLPFLDLPERPPRA
ncbi:MAG TPA: hypothetical protein VKY89_17815 [Thermoanaerobaculia bacterium]|jgi:hypothetical protein|nr:hypothetical protein [Thermoanaerobaculia bacterium]